MKENQLHHAEGIIYAIPQRTVTGKKDPTKTYTFTSVILEENTGYLPKPKELPEYHIRKRDFNLDNFSVGEPVLITFAMTGGDVPTKDGGTWHKTEAVLISIKHLDIDYNDTKTVDYSYKKPKPPEEDVLQSEIFPAEDDDDNENLPF